VGTEEKRGTTFRSSTEHSIENKTVSEKVATTRTVDEHK
jgi:hypothetical protein